MLVIAATKDDLFESSIPSTTDMADALIIDHFKWEDNSHQPLATDAKILYADQEKPSTSIYLRESLPPTTENYFTTEPVQVISRSQSSDNKQKILRVEASKPASLYVPKPINRGAVCIIDINFLSVLLILSLTVTW